MRVSMFPFVIIVLTCQSLVAEDWPQFRGPRGDGHSAARGLPTTWGGILEPPAWRTEIPGTGWSSPIVVGDRIWLTAAETTALPAEVQTRTLAENPFGQVDEFQAYATVSLLAIELNAASGEILRRLPLINCDDPPPIHLANSYASPTPVTDGELLYCHFGSLGTVAVSLATGQIVWRTRFDVEDITGPGASPVLSGERLILTCDGSDEQFVIALDKRTGAVAWRTPRPQSDAVEGQLRRAFSTPLVIHDGRRDQLVAPAAQWVVAYDPATGQELWRVNFGPGHAVVPRPVYRQGMVFICTGYWQPELWALRVDGTGDVTDTHVAWRYRKQVPLISSPIVVGDEIYFVSARGIAKCLDAETGELCWEHRLEGSFSASPLAGDEKLYFTNEQGITTVLRPGRAYQELAQNKIFGQTLASLAVAGESLLIRNAHSLYCVRQSSLE